MRKVPAFEVLDFLVDDETAASRTSLRCGSCGLAVGGLEELLWVLFAFAYCVEQWCYEL